MWIPIFMNTKQVQHFCRYSKSQAEANARKGSEFFLLFLRCIFYHQDINQVHRIRENPVLYLLNSISKLKPEKGFVDRSVYICFCVCICRQKCLYCPKVLPDAWRGWTVQDPDNGEKPSARPSSTCQWGGRWKDGEGILFLHLFIIIIKKKAWSRCQTVTLSHPFHMTIRKLYPTWGNQRWWSLGPLNTKFS